MSNLEGVSNFTKGPTKKIVVTKEENAKQTMAAILAVDPLNDRAFKKLIESVEWFQEIVQLLLERNIPDGTIVSIQGEAALTVNGKLIRMDNFRKTPLGSVRACLVSRFWWIFEMIFHKSRKRRRRITEYLW